MTELRMFRPEDRPKQSRLIRLGAAGVIRAMKRLAREDMTLRYQWVNGRRVSVNKMWKLLEGYRRNSVSKVETGFPNILSAHRYARSRAVDGTLVSIHYGFGDKYKDQFVVTVEDIVGV